MNVQFSNEVGSDILKQVGETQNNLPTHLKHGLSRTYGKNSGHYEHLSKVGHSGGTEETFELNYHGEKIVGDLHEIAAVPMVRANIKKSLPPIRSQDPYLYLSDTDEELDEYEESKQNISRCIMQASLTAKAAPNQSVRSSNADSSVKPAVKSNVGAGSNRGSVTSRTSIQLKREIVYRERPPLGTHFHMLATKNPALKVNFLKKICIHLITLQYFTIHSNYFPLMQVLYRYTNYRRKPLSESHKVWLDDREKVRIMSSQVYVKKLMDDKCAKALNKKEVGNEKNNLKEKNDSKSSGTKRTSVSTLPQRDSLLPKESAVKSKYKNAADFMMKNFPNFSHDDYVNENKAGGAGPMRTSQNNEIDQVMDAFAKQNLQIRENALRKAILTPQDNPDAICLEQLRTSSLEGLMLNPINKDLWRTFTKKSAKKKKNKTKSK